QPCRRPAGARDERTIGGGSALGLRQRQRRRARLLGVGLVHAVRRPRPGLPGDGGGAQRRREASIPLRGSGSAALRADPPGLPPQLRAALLAEGRRAGGMASRARGRPATARPDDQVALGLRRPLSATLAPALYAAPRTSPFAPRDCADAHA